MALGGREWRCGAAAACCQSQPGHRGGNGANEERGLLNDRPFAPTLSPPRSLPMLPDSNSSSLINDDLAPVSEERRTWTAGHFAALWIGMAVCIPTYTLAAGL